MAWDQEQPEGAWIPKAASLLWGVAILVAVLAFIAAVVYVASTYTTTNF